MGHKRLNKLLYLTVAISLSFLIGNAGATTDSGKWQKLWPSVGTPGINAVLPGIMPPPVIAISGHNPDKIYFGHSGRHVVVSEDAGASFHVLPEAPESMGGVGVADKNNESVLFYATDSSPLTSRNGDGAVLKSEDGGMSWGYIGGTTRGLASTNGLTRGSFTDLLIQYVDNAADPGNPKRNIYVAKYSDSGRQNEANGVYLLEDGHSQWEQVFSKDNSRSLAGTDNFNSLYVGVDQDGVYKLTGPNAPGNTSGKWISKKIIDANSNVAGHPFGKYFFDMKTGPDSGLVYVATDTGLFIIDSNDKPVLLRNLGPRAKSSPAKSALVEISPVNEDIIYLASVSNGIERTADRGKTWEGIGTGLDAKEISSLKIDPVRDVIYVSVGNTQLWKRESTPAVSKTAMLTAQALSAGTSGQITNSIGMTLMPIPPGTFTMGDNNTSGAKPAHQVTITSPFYMSAYEITNTQYEQFDPKHARNSKNPDDDMPVNSIRYSEAVAFCQWLTQKEASTTGLIYRLPHEIEWEYAAHGGHDYPFPNTDPKNLPSGMTWAQALRLEANTYGTGGPDIWEGDAPVGSLAPNGYGLYDMIGNAKEWCLNKMYNYPAGAEIHDPYNPGNVGDNKYHMMRGNSYLTGDYDALTVYYRIQYGNNDLSPKVGIRVIALPGTPVPQQLTAKASANPTTASVNNAVAFTGTALGGTSPYSYSWNFGDGATSTLASPSHAYSTAGSYTATLTVKDANSATSSASVKITVQAPPPPPPTGQLTATYLIATGNDDGHYKSSVGTVLGNATLNVGYGFLTGFRFANVGIPKGSTILSATLSSADEGTDRFKTLSIDYWGEASDNAAAFGTSGAQSISARVKTSATVNYPNVPTWDNAGSYYDSADLKSIVQEIVNRPGWAAGNAMVILEQGSSTTGRVIWAKEGYVNKPTKMTVTYFTP